MLLHGVRVAGATILTVAPQPGARILLRNVLTNARALLASCGSGFLLSSSPTSSLFPMLLPEFAPCKPALPSLSNSLPVCFLHAAGRFLYTTSTLSTRPPSVMSLPLLYPENPRGRMCSLQISLLVVTSPFSYITGSDIQINHQRI